ncbi:hypothetical protein ACFY4C_25780 [Actinomadura viridis]|uniref:hypothetical protein n=1 Tax=Actinomadura viridis TaxID=58110 RepID=UPI0036C38FDA
MASTYPRHRLSSQAVRIGMVSVLSLTVAACSSDTTPAAPSGAAATSPALAPSAEPDDDADVYCVATPEGGMPEEEPEEGYRIVDDDRCDEDDLGEDSTPPSYRPGSSRISYFWYYDPTRRSNGHASGGTLHAPEGGTVTTRSGKTARSGSDKIARSGFGGSAGGGG